jgi:hypothetical protein
MVVPMPTFAETCRRFSMRRGLPRRQINLSGMIQAPDGYLIPLFGYDDEVGPPIFGPGLFIMARI